ncbi:MAG: cytochrome c biogenesis protein ResB [Methylophilales bacterium]|nr:cytochrome c biogenesis protein ResB [Methylophilales bacterium]
MRFAISLLTVWGIAAIIGTVQKQNEPYTNYVIQLGQFWFEAFDKLGLYDVYHAPWFLLILMFVMVSTGLCVTRNTPSMLREMRAWREHVTESSLRLFKHQVEYQATSDLPRLQNWLIARGFRTRSILQQDGATLIVAKAGSNHRLGYIFTHLAIVVIFLGFLMDGDVPLKVQQMMGTKELETRDIPPAQVPLKSWLPSDTFSFRGNMTIPEGGRGSVAFLRIRDGYMIQDLPFSIELKQFRIEHYATGQPKSFESDVLIHDRDLQKPLAATIRVNHPLIYKGVAIYQSDFQDGGSELSFDGWELAGGESKPFKINANVFDKLKLTTKTEPLVLELDDFRPFNVLNLSPDGKGRPHNVGPSATFKLRDSQGQAHEYLNYMLPVMLEGRAYQVSGMRAAPNEPYQYLRIPLDENGAINTYMQWRALMSDTAKSAVIAKQLAVQVPEKDGLRSNFESSVVRLLNLFAHSGFNGLAGFIEKTVPAKNQEKAAQAYIKILEGAAMTAYGMTEQGKGKAPDVTSLNFVRDGLNTMSDSFLYGAPFYLQLTDYKLHRASGLQLTKSPGKNLVYAGSILLVLGIFAMFYIHERRIWLLVKENSVLFAMSSARKTRDFETEFSRLSLELRTELKLELES